MDERKFDLTCLGNLVLDLFAKPIDHFPEKGCAGYFDTLEMHPGGCAYNTGVDAARLGLRVAVQGIVGMDQFGDVMINSMKKESVDISGVCRTAEANTGFSFVMVPEDGQRRYYHTIGANAAFNMSNVSKEQIIQSRAFHVAGASLLPALDGTPTVELLRFAREHEVLTCLDPVVREDSANLILACIPYLDLFLPNNDESSLITGLSDPEDQLKFYLDKGAGIVGIKMGEKGVLISDGKKYFKLGIYRVPVVDTCGAGDAFVAGFIYGFLAKWDLMKTAMFATATAAFCVQSIGTTNAMPKAENVLGFMEKRKTPLIIQT